jgi:hypothetical protein
MIDQSFLMTQIKKQNISRELESAWILLRPCQSFPGSSLATAQWNLAVSQIVFANIFCPLRANPVQISLTYVIIELKDFVMSRVQLVHGCWVMRACWSIQRREDPNSGCSWSANGFIASGRSFAERPRPLNGSRAILGEKIGWQCKGWRCYDISILGREKSH